MTHPIWYDIVDVPMWDMVSKVMVMQAKETYKDFEIHTEGVSGRKTVAECLGGLDDSRR